MKKTHDGHVATPVVEAVKTVTQHAAQEVNQPIAQPTKRTEPSVKAQHAAQEVNQPIAQPTKRTEPSVKHPRPNTAVLPSGEEKNA